MFFNNLLDNEKRAKEMTQCVRPNLFYRAMSLRVETSSVPRNIKSKRYVERPRKFALSEFSADAT